MLEKLNEIRLQIADFLNIPLIDNKWILINFWSFVHFIDAFIIMFIIMKFKKLRKHKFLILFSILIFAEWFELFFYSQGIFFKTDTPVDIIWDMIVGMFGGFVCYKILTRNRTIVNIK